MLYFVLGNLFIRVAVLHFIAELFIALDANSACLEVSKMSTSDMSRRLNVIELELVSKVFFGIVLFAS